MKKVIRVNEACLRETVRRVLKEYINMKHSGHNLNDFLDDDDFLTIVNRTIQMYGPEDFEDSNSDYFDDIKMEIEDLIGDFISDEALDDFGYKYGTTDYRRVAANVFEYIRKHLNELYKIK